MLRFVPRTDKPWTAIARRVVLYNAGGKWRYALYSDAGVADGVLDGPPPSAAAKEAQAALLSRVADMTGHHYSAIWTVQEPRGWSAELSIVNP